LSVENGILNFPPVTETVFAVPLGVSLLRLVPAENVPVATVFVIELSDIILLT